MAVTKLHHAAYRCNDAQETADFYTKYLGLEYYAAVAEEDVLDVGVRGRDSASLPCVRRAEPSCHWPISYRWRF